MLILIRGLPGSGKSTFAKRVSEEIGLGNYNEADQFFELIGGFDQKLLDAAHASCYSHTALELAIEGISIVSNTFTRFFEMERYLQLAVHFKVPILIVHMRYDYKSIHDVPEHTLTSMRNRFQTESYLKDTIKNNPDWRNNKPDVAYRKIGEYLDHSTEEEVIAFIKNRLEKQ